MSRRRNTRKNSWLACLAAVALLSSLGCSADSPTAPDQVATDPPSVGANNWQISLNVSPNQLEAGSDVPGTVNVSVESRMDGSKPANGTTLTLSTSLGDFGAQDSGVKSIGVELFKGQASALLFPGSIAATGTVTARLEGSQKRDDFQVVGAVTAFISSISPSSGSESGGTRVTIQGVGFIEPLRVVFENGSGSSAPPGDDNSNGTTSSSNSAYGTVTSVTDTTIQVTTPGLPGSLDTQPCGNGGVEYLPTAVNVKIEFAGDSGGADLPDGFTYTPNTSGCIGG